MKITGPGQSALLLLEVLPILDKFNILYAVIGAFAASFYGRVRASMDVDLFVSMAPDNIENVLSEFREKGLKVTYTQGDIDDPIGAVVNVEDEFSNRVDFLWGIRGIDKKAFSRVVDTEFMKYPIKIIGIEDFIAMKIFAGSPKDIQDVIGVLSVSAEKIDLEMLNDLVSKYGDEELKKLKELLQD